MEHVGCVSTDLKKKHTNTQNTWSVHLFFLMPKKTQKHAKYKGGCLVHLSFCSWRKTQKHAKYKGGCPCAVWASPHVYNKTQKINPTKQVFSIAFLQGVKKYKNTQWLTIFFLVFMVKKTQNYIKHKRHIWSFSDLQRAISNMIWS